MQLAGVKGEAFYIAILRESFRDLITSIRGFCQIAGGNQRVNTAVHPLESHGAPEITLYLQLTLMIRCDHGELECVGRLVFIVEGECFAHAKRFKCEK